MLLFRVSKFRAGASAAQRTATTDTTGCLPPQEKWRNWHLFRCAFLLVLALVALPSVQGQAGVEKLKVELYSESLCPCCAEFIVNFLNPFYNNGLIDIVELRIIPFGNARILDGKLVCQHGPDECELNIIQTCAIRFWPKVLEMEFAAETGRLQPRWVLVNGEPLSDNYEDVAAYVCKAYEGDKPAVCS